VTDESVKKEGLDNRAEFEEEGRVPEVTMK